MKREGGWVEREKKSGQSDIGFVASVTLSTHRGQIRRRGGAKEGNEKSGRDNT